MKHRRANDVRVIIRPPTRRDAAPFLAAVRRSRALHRSWVSPPSTAKAFAEYLARASSESHRGFLVVHRRTAELVGAITLGHLIRGPLQSAFVGYCAFVPHAGAGLMHEGMLLVLDHAFRKLKLHRVEANIQPQNEASRRFARRCGFVREGYSGRYLKIRGRWQDHERWAILGEDFKTRRRKK